LLTLRPFGSDRQLAAFVIASSGPPAMRRRLGSGSLQRLAEPRREPLQLGVGGTGDQLDVVRSWAGSGAQERLHDRHGFVDAMRPSFVIRFALGERHGRGSASALHMAGPYDVFVIADWLWHMTSVGVIVPATG